MRKIVSTAAIASAASVVLLLLCVGSATAYTGEQYAKQASITMQRAEQIALKAQPGKITDRELEREGGGSGLRYSFDIKVGSKTHEVGIDAKTGHVLENSMEGPDSD
jgi:uncharacterized membrane protein YkoI